MLIVKMSQGTCPRDSSEAGRGRPQALRLATVRMSQGTCPRDSFGSNTQVQEGEGLRPGGIHMPRRVQLSQNDRARPGRLRLLLPELAPALPETAQTIRASSKRARGILALHAPRHMDPARPEPLPSLHRPSGIPQPQANSLKAHLTSVVPPFSIPRHQHIVSRTPRH